jgi:hypothetical protein
MRGQSSTPVVFGKIAVYGSFFYPCRVILLARGRLGSYISADLRQGP